MNERIVVGVDIGTTKVCAVVAAADELDRINILGVGVAESDGLNRGVVVNIDRTVASVQQAVREAERAAGVIGSLGDRGYRRRSRAELSEPRRHHDFESRRRDLAARRPAISSKTRRTSQCRLIARSCTSSRRTSSSTARMASPILSG
jgi:cell division protein FtsA